MKNFYSFFALFFSFVLCSQQQKSFHDTQGSIEVNGSGQLQFSLPIALPPGVKSVAPQINLVYTSGSSNGIAGYGWNLSGITAISRVGKNIDKDGKQEGVQLSYDDYYAFNGQRLVLKSGEYGKNGAEYVTEKFSNVKIKSVGSISGKSWQGPAYWVVTFEDGSQAWYGVGEQSKTPIEYNITKWKDAQGNYISYQYTQQQNVAVISAIQWGGNETLNKAHFNEIHFNYQQRILLESSFVAGEKFVQDKILSSVQVNTSGQQFKKYVISYDHGTNGTKYQFVKNITEYNSKNQPANPVTFEYEKSESSGWNKSHFSDNEESKLVGDFDGDGKLDFLKYYNAYDECISKEWEYIDRNDEAFGVGQQYEVCVEYKSHPAGLYLFRGAFDDVKQEYIYVGDLEFSKNDFDKRSVAITLKNRENKVESSQGIAIYRVKSKHPFVSQEDLVNKNNIELKIYSIKNQQLVEQDAREISYHLFDKSDGDDSMPSVSDQEMVSAGYMRTYVGGVKSLDVNSDGISELIWNFKDRYCDFVAIQDPYYNQNEREYYIPNYETQCTERNRHMIMDPDNGSFSEIDLGSSKTLDSYKIGDFDGDGKIDLLSFDGEGRALITRIDRLSSEATYTLKNSFFSQTNQKLGGVFQDAFTGDFNGDGKTDVLIPTSIMSFEWKLYLSTGKGFEKPSVLAFPLYKPISSSYKEAGRAYIYSRHYFVQDINQDGKADFLFLGTHARHNRVAKNHFSQFIIDYYENQGENENGLIQFEKKNIDGHVNSYKLLSPFSTFNKNYINRIAAFDLYPFEHITPQPGILEYVQSTPNGTVPTPHNVNALSPLVGNYTVNNTNHQILLLAQKAGVMVKYSSYEIGKASRVRSITQGGLRTEIEYKELDPSKNPDFYASVKEEKYPYMELDKVAQSYAVAQLRQEVEPNKFRKQDFRYRGFVTHLKGKGMIGFRQSARSSWYADGFENTKVWSGVEIDPLKEGLPTKEWSIRTNEEHQIFPKDLSLNNRNLLSFKETEYKIDNHHNGKVKAIVPIQITTKDFIKNVTNIDKIEYDAFYLPTKTISNTNQGFAEKITQIDYYPPNLTGEGKDYFVGRPRSKIELVRAYGDSKGAKEEYHYENNQLKVVRTYNRDLSGYLQEAYEYDGFGNIISKLIFNSFDSNAQKTTSQYDDKGRFVIEKIDNLGLSTKISYNDWGQVLTQIDPLGNTLTHVYDGWGKLLATQTNIGGITTYSYEKLENNDAKIGEYSSDNGETITYTNKIGQNYKSTTKSFGRGKYISKEVVYDALGRKIKESEPYFEGESATKWNTIEYDELSRPVRATAFTGKIVETEYTSNTVKVTETNAHNRFKKQTFDALGNITTTEDKGGIIEFKYNATGENIEAKYGTNVVTTQYDNWGRKVEFHDPSNGLYKYEYNHGFGLLTREISPKGEKNYQYNDKGLLIQQQERSTDGSSATEKTISFTYNDKGMILSKKGVSKGKEFSSHLRYDQYGRVIGAIENSFGKTYEKKNIVYDSQSRVSSYQKSLTSSGKTTSVVIENIYDAWSGELHQLKDKTTGKILWQLEETNAKAQVVKAKLGKTSIRNAYDPNGFLTSIHHSVENKPNVLSISYRFDAIKNELNSRTTGGAMNIIEHFVYDDNNRLINWTNPVTGAMHHNAYDKQGRIVENDQLGKVKFENHQKIYQATGVSLNPAGEENLKNNLIQSIGYNENNDPTFIDGVKGDVRFEYGLTEMRQMVSFGGNIEDQANGQGRYTRYYSEDGSFEITIDNQTGKEKHILYIGGNPYESNIIFVKNYDETEGSYKFLHKDYLGSILAITDEEGNKLEQRHYDAWGNLTHLQIGNGEIITDDKIIHQTSLIIDRGYTSHEHFFEVGIIHMNGRLYDPMLRRFLNADENIQDPHNTQNYNKYSYVFNNPLMFNDPSGEFIFAALAAWLGSKVLAAAVIGAAVGLVGYTVGLAVSGNLYQWNLGGALKATFFGAVGGAVSFGVGSIFSNTAGTLTTFANNLNQSIGGVGLAIVQAGTHAISQGVLGVMQGESFLSSVATSFVSSLVSSGFKSITDGWAYQKEGMLAFGVLSGGVTAELTGGNFWQGVATSAVVVGLNHLAHMEKVATNPPGNSISEWLTDYFDYNGDGKVAGWDYALGVVDVGMTAFDILTIPSGEGMATHFALKGSARVVAKTSFNISAKSIKGYNKVREIGGKYVVYSKEVKASNLKGQAKAIYYKVFDTKGNTIKMYKDSYRIDGTFYHRRNIKPEFKNTPRYSK